MQRNLLALPARSRGLSLTNPVPNPVQEAVRPFRTSIKVTAPLVQLILQQSRVYPFEAIAELSKIKSEVRQEKKRELALTEASVLDSLSNPLRRAKELASEKGASSWLIALPIADHGHKEPSVMPSV